VNNNTLEQNPLLWTLFQQLLRRGFLLGIDDYYALSVALRAGFGWNSRETLCDLCIALWAKSLHEQSILKALFNNLLWPNWVLPKEDQIPIAEDIVDNNTMQDHTEEENTDLHSPSVYGVGNLPPITLNEIEIVTKPFVFTPQFPVSYRETAQIWRHLRQMKRDGPKIELDVEETIAQRVHQGVVSPIILKPRRRNRTKLLLLVDRKGSMAPFHTFTDEVCKAIVHSGMLGATSPFYFHDVPVHSTNKHIVTKLFNQPFPTLDTVLHIVEPSVKGFVTLDPSLLSPYPLKDILDQFAEGAAVIILSDGGAARNYYDVDRLINTIAFLKALRDYTKQLVWLNPLPQGYWKNSTAFQISRHIPMFQISRIGMFLAVDVLKGRPHHVEKPL